VTLTTTQRTVLASLSVSLSKFGEAVDTTAAYCKSIGLLRLAFVVYMLHESLEECREAFASVLAAAAEEDDDEA